MINYIIDFSIKNKLVIGLFTLLLAGLGIWSMTRVPIDAVPDITNNQVQIITQSPDLGTEDIEQFITYPVELAMANIPGVLEIRSVSRFGLSLVTIVFEDDMGTYLPRQLVNEKLNHIRDQIPAEFGKPEMGPISTGLGEIYQYTLEVDSQYSYTPMELRSVQDWIIRRQLAMVPGVVEVNAFGGSVKQYEVAVKTHELKAIGLGINDVYKALEANNHNAGGAYIVKDRMANFIRGEGLARSVEDIEQIVIRNVNGIPILIKNIADVRMGSAVRYGAFTQNGQGEAVGGMILMLKDANSNSTIKAIKQRISEIQKSLPEGIRIVPFLDRSKLIKRTTGTITTNLLEGGLIVIFILVLLLGNWRGGLVVASTIPLSLLFAFIMMYAFGVWANLMSLGAIDFGIIVDGAVIIVESTVFLLARSISKSTPNEVDRDKIASKAARKMMNSAFFGQLIILIVFVPILALEGVEGKMFKPMALTFIFAMLGAMILCLTYVPMMSSWFIRPSKESNNFGNRLVKSVENTIGALLRKLLNKSRFVIGSALVLLSIAIYSFSRLGGEFIPQLDEGDIAFHIIMRPGSSLDEAVKTSTMVENILLEKFEEVEKVMSRFGVADVPTDPMPMDVADCFIILKPPGEWVNASTKEELTDKIKEELMIIPGINYEFTQPIEMRFNELITGVREDVAIKLFGEDLQVLADKASEISSIISDIDGIGDLKVEATTGLPQIKVNYQREKLAQYGLEIHELNDLVRTAFAGKKAGIIFEGERRYDLVLKLDSTGRTNIDDLKNLYLSIPSGSQIPLKEVAEIDFSPGPMQISRDNTNRRTYVGINVRGRDIRSLVDEIRTKLDAELTLPPGYYIRYGGAFENLERATMRLKILVPVALVLIFVLIFFALRSMRQSIMIYMAIPLAAIGGVFSLLIRDLPFSISAGVGFIVLFGVAVLNGLVLISGFNELKAEGVTNITERILKGTRRRIRPILLTALTDILGFLPMAVSVSAGAEVQRPLATVVIGGLITSTFLTLLVLPILYYWLEQKKPLKMTQHQQLAIWFLAILFLPVASSAQEQNSQVVIDNPDKAIEVALASNGDIKVARVEVRVQEKLRWTAFNPGKTDLGLQYGQYNSFENDLGFNLSQRFEFPLVYLRQGALSRSNIESSKSRLRLEENDLKKAVRKLWYELNYLHAKHQTLKAHDSLYTRVLKAVELKYQEEESSYLEKTSAEARVLGLRNHLKMNEADLKITQRALLLLLNNEEIKLEMPDLERRTFNLPSGDMAVDQHPLVDYSKQQVQIAKAERSLARARALPDITIGYFNQSMNGNPLANGEPATSSDRFTGVQAGLSIPLFFGAHSARAGTARIRVEQEELRTDYQQKKIREQLRAQLDIVQKQSENLGYHEDVARTQAERISSGAQVSYESGDIGYVEYFQHMSHAMDLQMGYLKSLNDYNQAVIGLEHLTAQ